MTLQQQRHLSALSDDAWFALVRLRDGIGKAHADAVYEADDDVRTALDSMRRVLGLRDVDERDIAELRAESRGFRV